MDIKTQVIEIAGKAKKAAAALGKVNSEEKNSVLLRMAEALVERRDFLIAENAKDLDGAVRTGLPAAMMDRLTLKDQTIQGMAGGSGKWQPCLILWEKSRRCGGARTACLSAGCASRWV
jgi:glutamate-5-semialdehyde dehydrogenase